MHSSFKKEKIFFDSWRQFLNEKKEDDICPQHSTVVPKKQKKLNEKANNTKRRWSKNKEDENEKGLLTDWWETATGQRDTSGQRPPTPIAVPPADPNYGRETIPVADPVDAPEPIAAIEYEHVPQTPPQPPQFPPPYDMSRLTRTVVEDETVKGLVNMLGRESLYHEEALSALQALRPDLFRAPGMVPPEVTVRKKDQ